MSEQLLTMDDVTKRLLISRQSVHKWINKGKLQPIRIGKRIIRFEAAEIDRFIKDSKTQREDKVEPAKVV